MSLSASFYSFKKEWHNFNFDYDLFDSKAETCYMMLTQTIIQSVSHSVQFSSVTQSCPTLCNPINCSMPGLPVHHQLLEFTQTQVHRVGNAIQPSLSRVQLFVIFDRIIRDWSHRNDNTCFHRHIFKQWLLCIRDNNWIGTEVAATDKKPEWT